VLALLAALVCAAAASSAERPTVVHYYAAFDNGKLASDLNVTERVRGYCPSESGILVRRYAWRCFGGRYIYDPCFSRTARSGVVVCSKLPWSKKVRLMRLTRPLPSWTQYRNRRNSPWGIWTATGKRCFALSHVQGTVAGRPQTYNCVGGGVLAGYADRRRPAWRIYYAPSWRSKRVTPVRVTDAWW